MLTTTTGLSTSLSNSLLWNPLESAKPDDVKAYEKELKRAEARDEEAKRLRSECERNSEESNSEDEPRLLTVRTLRSFCAWKAA